MKNNKIIIILLIISLTLAGNFTACQLTVTQETKKTALPTLTQEQSEESEEKLKVTAVPSPLNEADKNGAEEEFISQRIKYFTKEYYRFTEDVQVETEDGKTSVSVTFTPEVGSIVIKEDLYENIVFHADQITNFFPEVNHFYYIVLSQQHEKGEALYLTIDEEAVENLGANYLNQLINRNGGHDTHFSKVFSEIVETEESSKWRDRIGS